MTIVLHSTYIQTVRETRAPSLHRASPSGPNPVVSDIFRYRSIGGLQALGLAITAAIVTPILLWLVL